MKYTKITKWIDFFGEFLSFFEISFATKKGSISRHLRRCLVRIAGWYRAYYLIDLRSLAFGPVKGGWGKMVP